MQRVIRLALVATVACAVTATVAGQKTTPGVVGEQTGVGTGGSPHWKADWTIHGAHIVMEYGRPYLKGRPESQMMPPGKPWRTGADEATIITSDKPLTFGTIALAAGTTYTINTQPGETWQLVIGKLSQKGQWGIPYQPALEIGRAPMTVGKTAAPVEQVTFFVDSTASGGTLRLEWGTTRATIPFKVG